MLLANFNTGGYLAPKGYKCHLLKGDVLEMGNAVPFAWQTFVTGEATHNIIVHVDALWENWGV